METWRTLHPRRILHAPGAISAHGCFRQASLEPGPSGQELRILLIGQLRPQFNFGTLKWFTIWESHLRVARRHTITVLIPCFVNPFAKSMT